MKEFGNLMKGLRCSCPILSEFVRGIPAEKMNLRRGDGFWTIGEHVNHLAIVQPMLAERIQKFLDEAEPRFIPYIPDDDDTDAGPPRMAVSEALDRFSKGREQQVRLLETAADADWEKTADHPEYDRYSLPILARHILMHDFWHMYRMEELWLTRDAYLTKLV